MNKKRVAIPIKIDGQPFILTENNELDKKDNLFTYCIKQGNNEYFAYSLYHIKSNKQQIQYCYFNQNLHIQIINKILFFENNYNPNGIEEICVFTSQELNTNFINCLHIALSKANTPYLKEMLANTMLNKMKHSLQWAIRNDDKQYLTDIKNIFRKLYLSFNNEKEKNINKSILNDLYSAYVILIYCISNM